MTRVKLRGTSLGLVSLLALAGACSSEAPPPRNPEAPVAVAAQPAASAMPAVVDDLGTLVPLGAVGVVELPDVAKVVATLTPAQRGLATLGRPTAEREIADKMGVSADLVRDLGDAFERAVAFTDGKGFAVIARFADAGPPKQLVALMDPQPAASAPGRAVFQPRSSSRVVAWYDKPRVLVVATSPELASRVDRVAEHAEKSFAESPRRLPPDPIALRVYGDLGALAAGQPDVAGLVDPGSSARASVSLDLAHLASKLELSLVGDRLPRLAGVLAPRVPSLAARLPDETVAFVTIGLERKPGKTLRDVARELTRPADGGGAVAARFEEGMKGLFGFDLAELDGVVGGEGHDRGRRDAARSIEHRAHERPRARRRRVRRRRGAGRRAREEAARRGRAPGEEGKVGGVPATITPTSIRWTAVRGDDPPIRVDLHPGAVLVASGAPKLVERAAAAFDRKERTLGASAAYASTSSVRSQGAQGFLWMDTDRIAEGVSPTIPKTGKVGTSRALLGPSDRGLDLVVEGQGGADVAIVGTLAALGVYGVQRYLTSAKTAQAKNTIGAISRAVVVAYERETFSANAGPSAPPVHKLCKSAQAVPRAVPAGVKYQPSAKPGDDFDSGSDDAGWRCLKFAMTMPHYYQYEYRQGGSYKGPKRGGPDPGPNGFRSLGRGRPRRQRPHEPDDAHRPDQERPDHPVDRALHRRREQVSRSPSSTYRGVLAALGVVAALGLCVVVAAPFAWSRYKEARVRSVATACKPVEAAAALWLKTNTKEWCPTLEDLVRSGMLSPRDVDDPWGMPFYIVCEGGAVRACSSGGARKYHTPYEICDDFNERDIRRVANLGGPTDDD